jgi:hypothetical protein
MDVKKKAIEFEIRTPQGDHLGDCYINMAGFVWCRGRTTKKNGVKVEWQEFMDLLANEDALQRAVKAAKKPCHN